MKDFAWCDHHETCLLLTGNHEAGMQCEATTTLSTLSVFFLPAPIVNLGAGAISASKSVQHPDHHHKILTCVPPRADNNQLWMARELTVRRSSLGPVRYVLLGHFQSHFLEFPSPSQLGSCSKSSILTYRAHSCQQPTTAGLDFCKSGLSNVKHLHTSYSLFWLTLKEQARLPLIHFKHCKVHGEHGNKHRETNKSTHLYCCSTIGLVGS